MGGSTTTDMGVYPILLAQWVFREEEPTSIQAAGKLNKEDVDIEMIAELTYSGNKVARIRTSTVTTFGNEAKIVGTKGQITVDFTIAFT